MSEALSGIGVLVTRPVHQAEPLCELISAHGGSPIRFPTLAIEPVSDPSKLKPLSELSDYEIVLFVSRNAVNFSLPEIRKQGGIPSGSLVGAVGKGTMKALDEAGIPVDILPAERFDSEGLLACDALNNVGDKRILIVKGEGGRALLGDTLKARGARVDFVEAYRRTLPDSDPGPLIERWRRDIQIVTATSKDVLDNLAAMLGERGRALLRTTPLLVISERMKSRAEELQVEQILLASGADSRSIMDSLERWALRR